MVYLLRNFYYAFTIITLLLVVSCGGNSRLQLCGNTELGELPTTPPFLPEVYNPTVSCLSNASVGVQFSLMSRRVGSIGGCHFTVLQNGCR